MKIIQNHINQTNHSSENNLNHDFNKIKRLPRFFSTQITQIEQIHTDFFYLVHLVILKILIQTKREIITSKPQPKVPLRGI